MKGAHFVAAYDSMGECGHEIYEGDEAGYVDDVLVCGDCYEAEED